MAMTTNLHVVCAFKSAYINEVRKEEQRRKKYEEEWES